MSSKNLILRRIREALGDNPAQPEIPRDYRRAAEAPVDLDLLVERLEDYKAVVHRTSDISDAISRIVGDGQVVAPPGVPVEWLPRGSKTDNGLTAAEIAESDGVVTAAAVAIVETGTIVLDASPDQGRRILSLLPDLHICVLRPDQVVASVPEAVARLTPGRPLTWISGPSATSDIELNRVEGVHGPRNLHIVLVEEAA
ncbi:LUD domain-containing protein [Actinoplanes sp. LDG1-06]|uniref:LUD domain-containing protein n=1 Tax=Paractinoplanes ovalisporus TaxID=2810368 RepID=A0ABS2AEI0_9ACTN|nr:LUD domain-containing protein [Actinoplanes ovalisporus]MBM2618227.1 LUD domain-containing protein [Actinoplanes ovalisporus]